MAWESLREPGATRGEVPEQTGIQTEDCKGLLARLALGMASRAGGNKCLEDIKELARAEVRLPRLTSTGKRRLQSQLASSSKALVVQEEDLRQRCAALSEAADQLASKALGKGEGTCEKGKSEGESSGKA